MKQNRYAGIKQITGAALIAVTALSLFACNNPAVQTQSADLMKDMNAQAVESREIDDTFRTAAASFSIELFRQSAVPEVSAGKNVLISPESVLSALAMTANGAKDTTRMEMENVICGGMDIQDFNSYMYTYNNKLTATEDVTFHLANSIWIKDDPAEIQVKNDFLQTDKDYYNADAFLADFDESTVTDINNWVNANTNGMINQLLDIIPDDVVMYLINALAFEGAWETPYEEAQINENDTFTNHLGAEETVTMMISTESQYISGEDVTGFVKNYEGGDYAFLALLPEEGMTVEEYLASMDGASFLSLYDNRTYQDVLVKIPEFTYDYDTELSDSLIAMGMENAFERTADFSNMADTSTGALYINRVLHKTYIQVDRVGTKAAAVTAVEMTNECAMIDPQEPPAVYLDRPFIYAIIDTETGLPVFIGTVSTIN